MKIENWRSRLLAVMDEQERHPHIYSESDCIFRIGWNSAAQLMDPKKSEILAMMERYRGRYKTIEEANSILAKDGFTPLTLVSHFFAEIHPVEACDGDIAAVLQDGVNWAFGTIVGPHFYVSTLRGTGILPRGDAQKAFRVE